MKLPQVAVALLLVTLAAHESNAIIFAILDVIIDALGGLEALGLGGVGGGGAPFQALTPPPSSSHPITNSLTNDNTVRKNPTLVAQVEAKSALRSSTMASSLDY